MGAHCPNDPIILLALISQYGEELHNCLRDQLLRMNAQITKTKLWAVVGSRSNLLKIIQVIIVKEIFSNSNFNNSLLIKAMSKELNDKLQHQAESFFLAELAGCAVCS